jgi:hypothetical protein
LSTVPQHQWISKLFGFDFTVEYRPGRLNTVADALSYRDSEREAEGTEGVAACALSGPSFAFLNDMCHATTEAEDTQHLLQ